MNEQFVPGLENVPAVKTKVSALDVVKEKIIIRGYDLIELAQAVPYLDVAYLLLYEHLPTASQARDFAALMQQQMHIPDVMYEIFQALPKGMDAMDLLRTGLSILSGYEDHQLLNDNSKTANIQKGIKILAKAPVIMVNAYRANQGLPFVKPDPSLSFSENFLYMIQGAKPDADTTKMFDLILTCYIDHELPNSTFTARVIASTLSDMYGAIVGGVASLKGPLHGGANEACVRMMLEVLENGGSAKAEEIIMAKLARKDKIMGFGHRVYMKKYDPRALLLKDYVPKLIHRHKDGEELYKIFQIIEKVMAREKGIYPNADYPIGLMFYLLGIPIDLYTPIFFCSRIAGLVAHITEQHADNRLIRPRALYEGAMDLHVSAQPS